MRRLAAALALLLLGGPAEAKDPPAETYVQLTVDPGVQWDLHVEYPGGSSPFVANGSANSYRARIPWPINGFYYSDDIRLVARYSSRPGDSYTVQLRLHAFEQQPLRVRIRRQSATSCFLQPLQEAGTGLNVEDALNQLVLASHLLRVPGSPCTASSIRFIDKIAFANALALAGYEQRFRVPQVIVARFRQSYPELADYALNEYRSDLRRTFAIKTQVAQLLGP